MNLLKGSIKNYHDINAIKYRIYSTYLNYLRFMVIFLYADLIGEIVSTTGKIWINWVSHKIRVPVHLIWNLSLLNKGYVYSNIHAHDHDPLIWIYLWNCRVFRNVKTFKRLSMSDIQQASTTRPTPNGGNDWERLKTEEMQFTPSAARMTHNRSQSLSC